MFESTARILEDKTGMHSWAVANWMESLEHQTAMTQLQISEGTLFSEKDLFDNFISLK